MEEENNVLQLREVQPDLSHLPLIPEEGTEMSLEEWKALLNRKKRMEGPPMVASVSMTAKISPIDVIVSVVEKQVGMMMEEHTKLMLTEFAKASHETELRIMEQVLRANEIYVAVIRAMLEKSKHPEK